MNPLPDLPQKPTGPNPQKPHEPLPDIDLVTYAAALSAVAATQYYSKSYPHLAGEVTKNVAGPEIAAGAGKFNVKNVGTGLMIGPAPIGFIDPTAWGWEPNWPYAVESRLRELGMGLERLTPPPSTILHTLPDNDPRVQFERYKVRARDQLFKVKQATTGLTLEQLLDVYDVARSPEGARFFYNPPDVADALRRVAAQRAGGEQQLAAVLNEREIARPAPALPLDTAAPVAIPQPTPAPAAPLAPLIAGFPVTPREPATTIDVRFGLRETPIPPLSTPPPNNLQRDAFNRAPPLLKELASERSDP